MIKNPQVIELNAFLFLQRVRNKYPNRSFNLAFIPDEEWQQFKTLGYDYVWMMGVWKRSPKARDCALKDGGLRKQYDGALSSWREEDVVGSPYAVYDYEIDPYLGMSGDLKVLRAKLNQYGLKLILDFVPNHLALDHVLTKTNPEMFVQGDLKHVEKNPNLFFEVEKGIHVAHGKDPYFDPWMDTAQVNYFSQGYRDWALSTLLKIADVSDGVRCDMAMLGLSDVFVKNWKPFLKGSFVGGEFWSELIGQVKDKCSQFVFIAESYWDKEWDLQQRGFDFTYDKRLYDRLRYDDAKSVGDHLKAAIDFQGGLLRFIENHDERRAADIFKPIEKNLAAVVICLSVPGMRLIHEGQSLGWQGHHPIQLIRQNQHQTLPDLAAAYEKILKFTSAHVVKNGYWRLLEIIPSYPLDETNKHLLAWRWQEEDEYRLIVVNYSGQQARGRIILNGELSQRESAVIFLDEYTGDSYHRHSQDIMAAGLFVDLKPWAFHLFRVRS